MAVAEKSALEKMLAEDSKRTLSHHTLCLWFEVFVAEEPVGSLFLHVHFTSEEYNTMLEI